MSINSSSFFKGFKTFCLGALFSLPINLAAEGPYEFAPPVFDIAALPNGDILVAQGTDIKQIRRRGNGGVRDIISVPTVPGSPINGLAPLGVGTFFATSGGLDLALGAAVWRGTRGKVREVASIEDFEIANDPDAFEGPQWKDQRCEEDPNQGFSAGPQSNPYHTTPLSGSNVLVADAAGNTLLDAKTNGDIDWVAVFTPPLDQLGDWAVLFTLPDGTDCYVQPVPTSVDIGPDGAYYVGELTGFPAIPGWSRIWRIEGGARNVTCPSADCTEVISGMTSIVDVEFGPDGLLYVVEFDAAGWFAATVLGTGVGGSVKACDVDTGSCDVVADNLVLPGAITFDKWGGLWLLENNVGGPMVYLLNGS